MVDEEAGLAAGQGGQRVYGHITLAGGYLRRDNGVLERIGVETSNTVLRRIYCVAMGMCCTHLSVFQMCRQCPGLVERNV